MTDKEVAEMLRYIKSVYQNFSVNDGVVEAWIDIFKDYEKDSIMASLKKYVKSNEYCPVPASIIKLYNDGKAVMDRSIGKNINDLVEILTFMLNRSNVFPEIDFYKSWLKKQPEMQRMSISNKTVARLKEYANSHLGEEFDFKKWLGDS